MAQAGRDSQGCLELPSPRGLVFRSRWVELGAEKGISNAEDWPVKREAAGVLLGAALAASACAPTTIKDIEQPMVAAQAGKPTVGTGLWPCGSFAMPAGGVTHPFSVSGRSF